MTVPENLQLTPVTFNLTNPALHPQAQVTPDFSGTTDDAK
jgi:hypothetical protein